MKNKIELVLLLLLLGIFVFILLPIVADPRFIKDLSMLWHSTAEWWSF